MMNCDPNTNWGPSIEAAAKSSSYEEYLELMAQYDTNPDPCRPTCAARRNPNAECVCAELDALEGR